MKEKSPKRPSIEAQINRKTGKAAPVRARLLVVEDHEPTRGALQEMLEARNFKVKAAGTIADAWALVRANTFDLLLSDIGLPDGDGYLLMRELADLHGMRGIALTGYGLDDDIKLSKEAGFSAHIVKPIRAKVLDETLRNLGV
jgi:CheY-like chemotaxis protein